MSHITFYNEGKVDGLDDYHSYFICTDFVVAVQNNLDQVCFDLDSKRTKCFHFKLSNDTLKLYETAELYDHVTLAAGKRKYLLIKLSKEEYTKTKY